MNHGRIRRWAVSAVALVLTITVSMQVALACTCADLNICQRVELSGVIFLGEVIQGGLDPGEDAWSGRPQSATLRVVEAYRGIPQGALDVVIKLQYLPGMCSPAVYRRGEQTLVFLSRQADGTLQDGACGGSRFAKDVPEELKYVRDYFAGRTQTSIIGRISSNETIDLAAFGKSVEGALVVAEGSGGRHTTRTDSEGNYKLAGLSPGKYRIHAEKSGFTNNHEDEPRSFSIEIKGRNCAMQDLTLWTNNSLEGSVRNETAGPASGVSVFLQEVGEEMPWGGEEMRSDGSGNFKFEHISPGRYYLVVSPNGAMYDSPYESSFYGGAGNRAQAQTIEINPTSKLKSMNIHLGPAISTRTIRVRLAWPDGNPLNEAFVVCAGVRAGEKENRATEQGIVLGKDGVGECKALIDRPYLITVRRAVWFSELKDTPPVSIPAGSTNSDVRIQLGPSDAIEAGATIR